MIQYIYNDAKYRQSDYYRIQNKQDVSELLSEWMWTNVQYIR